MIFRCGQSRCDVLVGNVHVSDALGGHDGETCSKARVCALLGAGVQMLHAVGVHMHYGDVE